MTTEKTIAETAQDARKPKEPAPAPRRNPLPLFLGIFFLLLLIVAGVIGGLIFFGIIDIDGTPTPEPTATPFNVLDPLAEYDECAPLVAANPNLFCNPIEVETDTTWTNALPTAAELITEDMSFAEVANPGAIWLSPVNTDRPLEKVFYLPEGEVEFAEVRINIAASFPLKSVALNGEVFEEGRHFTYNLDEMPFPLALNLLRPLPAGSTPAFRDVNLRQFLHAGRNVIQFTFADISSIATPEVTINPEVTIDPNATEPPLPTFALLAQVRIPVTGIYNSVQSERYFSNADWQGSPAVGVYPTASSDVLGDAQWIQGVDKPDEGQETVSVDRVFYLADTDTSFALTVDVRNGTLSNIFIQDGFGNSHEVLLPPSGGTTLTEGSISFQRYEAIPISSGFSVGLNRLVIAYAPNSNTEHYLRLRVADSDGETFFVSDEQWMRGEFRAESTSDADSVTLTAEIQRGTAHLRGFVARPSGNVAGNVIVTCLQARGDIPCSTMQLRYENNSYSFGTENTITLQAPEPLFNLDLSFQSDSALEDFATVRLSLLYVDATGASQNISAGSVWYSYRPVEVITNANSAWAVVDDAAFIFSPNDSNEGEYISVFETSLLLPANAVIIASEFAGSVDDHLLAIYINDHLAYQGNLVNEDFRQVTIFPIDGALLREGQNRIVVHVLNKFGGGALAMRFSISYFTQANP